ncbi:MAG: hypothetical protein A2172_04665 [Candidatus Woykebacteria bacterium RBG_13_40_15]|uniref:Aminotransferase class I/classII large domain-containing protein n=1 Tax=Candidatus Woykebacteria bacterium RBG_13_40_15 TaxID=1802593 RepID=A0A1G1W729_9BACT|nr:MAG: hypothetical protein A2172_04665 [Candidatus Woykebacteria bacterium RBG_13_40_15]
MPNRWLPEGEENLFQRIKAQREAAAAKGIKIIDLSIGQPQGPALLSARKEASRAVLSSKEAMHSYQDNGCLPLPDFASQFIQSHMHRGLDGFDIAFLPIPGIKPVLSMIPLACGAEKNSALIVETMTNPGYPTPLDVCKHLRLRGIHELPLTPENGFSFALSDSWGTRGLMMLNYPHNPSGQIAIKNWWWALCEYCVTHGIRLFNDAAYAALWHTEECCTLTEVAVSFPDLSWVEAFSASKLIGNGTGWRIGALVGSSDFVADIAAIKGKMDSGFAAPLAAGVLAATESDRDGINTYREMYRQRSEMLTRLLSNRNVRIAVPPKAGFFTLWKVPAQAFGEEVQDAPHFNSTMIERTGVVGVPFDSKQGAYIRYAVCGDIGAMERDLEAAFDQAAVSYN